MKEQNKNLPQDNTKHHYLVFKRTFINPLLCATPVLVKAFCIQFIYSCKNSMSFYYCFYFHRVALVKLF